MSTLTLERTVGELVTERPNRARIFESFGIDFCCGGHKSLAKACEAKNLDPNQILGVLKVFDEQASRQTQEPDWSKATMTELCDNIEKTHHAYLKEELPRLQPFIEKVASKHGADDPRLVEVRNIFLNLQAEMFSHMAKEEQVLFPICRQMDGAAAPVQAHCGSVQNPIRVMMLEHDDAGTALSRIRKLTDNYTAPADACNTFRALLDSLKTLEEDMHRHVHKENSILFPKAVEVEAKLATA